MDKKDIWVLVSAENNTYLHNIPGFVSKYDYSKNELFYPEEYGKIETLDAIIHFQRYCGTVKHENGNKYLYNCVKMD